MDSKLITLFASTVLKRPAITLLVLIALVAFLAFSLPNLKLEASGDALVLEGDKALEIFRESNKRYGSEEFLVVTYTPYGSLYSDEVLGRIAELRDELTVLPGVSSVVSLLDVPLLYSPMVSISSLADDIRYLRDPEVDRRLVQKELSSSPIYKDLITSRSASTTALQVNLIRDDKYGELLKARDALRLKRRTGEISAEERQELKIAEREFRDHATMLGEQQRELVERVRVLLEPYRSHASIFLGGIPMIAADMISFIQSDLVIFGSGIVLFFIVMLASFFRRVRWVFLPLFCCVMTVTAMLGFFTWIDWRMTVISSNFVALLLIMTLSVAIHLVVRYRELHSVNPQAEQRELVLETVRFMAKPCAFTSLTTIVAFASLVVSGIRPVIDFGWMMTIGVGVALLMTFIIMPAGMLLLKKTEATKQSSQNVAMTLVFAKFADRHALMILIGSALLLAISIYGISKLEVENRFIDYFNPKTEIYQGMETIDRELGGTISLDIIIRAEELLEEEFMEGEDDFADDYVDDFADDDDFADEGGAYEHSYWFSRSGLEDLEKIHDFMESHDETGKVLSLATLYKVVRDIGGKDIDDIQLAIIKQNLSGEIRKVVIDPYLSADGKEARIALRVMETSHSLRRADLLASVERFLQEDMELNPENFDITGMLVLYNNMLQSLYTSQIITLGTVFLSITAMFTILFRSFYLALIAIAPNILAAAMVLGGMGIAGVPLDMMTITIAAVTVGIGVDDAIHYIHRFKVEFPKDRNYIQAMYRCHASIGSAMYYTSVTIIVGFSILALSNFTPSLYFGLLTGFAMFCALIGALVLLPLLLKVFKPLGKEAESAL